MGARQGTFETIIRLVGSVSNLDDLDHAMRVISKDLGFQYFALTHHVDILTTGHAIHLHNYPEHWADYYERNALGLSDPVHRASQRMGIGFSWSRLPLLVALMVGKGVGAAAAQDLVIARDYLTRGFRERAVELVDLDLGPPTVREVEARLSREIDQDRLTSIDRRLLREADEQGVVTAVAINPLEQSALAGRLRKLERMGLAEPVGGGRFELATGLAETLTEVGENFSDSGRSVVKSAPFATCP